MWLKELLGAKKVNVFNHAIRRKEDNPNLTEAEAMGDASKLQPGSPQSQRPLFAQCKMLTFFSTVTAAHIDRKSLIRRLMVLTMKTLFHPFRRQ